MTATLPLPAEASGFRADIAEKVRSNWPIEIDTAGADELELLELPPLGALLEEELLHAAAARHKASDADAATAPFLTMGIM
jgi:hypothetical protein